MGSWSHRITHGHTIAMKPKVGEVVLCRRRLSRRIKWTFFRPDLADAGWHRVAAEHIESVFAADDAYAAMAVVRSLDQ